MLVLYQLQNPYLVWTGVEIEKIHIIGLRCPQLKQNQHLLATFSIHQRFSERSNFPLRKS